MSTTTVVDFKAALLAAIKTRAAAPGVWIGYGDGPGRTNKSIRLRESFTPDTAEVKPAGFRGGRPRLDETYVLRVECEVIGQATPEASERAVVALGDHVEDAVFDPSVHQLPHVWEAIPSGRALDTDQAGSEIRSTYLIHITVKART